MTRSIRFRKNPQRSASSASISRSTDGRRVGIEALYIAPGLRLSSPLAEQLGCVLEDGPAGRLIKVDASMMTSVPGVYAAGDLARPFGNAMLAAADGVLAGGAASGALILTQPPRFRRDATHLALAGMALAT